MRGNVASLSLPHNSFVFPTFWMKWRFSRFLAVHMKCCTPTNTKIPNFRIHFRDFYLQCFWFYVSVEDKVETTLDAVLSDAYCRSHMFLSKQMAKLRPELTMPMFSGKYFWKMLLKPRKKIQRNAGNKASFWICFYCRLYFCMLNPYLFIFE